MRAVRKIIREIFPSHFKKFTDTKSYWKMRYKYGGNSGKGSYGESSENKAAFLNALVKEKGFTTVIEIGSGDGNNALLYTPPQYIGFDISKDAVKIAHKACAQKQTHSFIHLDENFKANIAKIHSETPDQKILVISFDVMFHLIEEDTYQEYLKTLDLAADSHILVFATDKDIKNTQTHVKHRKYSTDLCALGWDIQSAHPEKNGQKEYKLFKRKA